MSDIETIKVSAPSKIHLLGEHFVVYGAPALLAAVDRRCQVIAHPTSDETIKITSHNLETSENYSVEQLVQTTDEAKAQWDEFVASNDPNILKGITSNPLSFAAIAVGEAFKAYGQTRGLSLEIQSDVPIGASI